MRNPIQLESHLIFSVWLPSSVSIVDVMEYHIALLITRGMSSSSTFRYRSFVRSSANRPTNPSTSLASFARTAIGNTCMNDMYRYVNRCTRRYVRSVCPFYDVIMPVTYGYHASRRIENVTGTPVDFHVQSHCFLNICPIYVSANNYIFTLDPEATPRPTGILLIILSSVFHVAVRVDPRRPSAPFSLRTQVHTISGDALDGAVVISDVVRN